MKSACGRGTRNMATNDDVAGLSDQELVTERDNLKNRLMTLREIESQGAINSKFLAEMHDVESRLSRVEARIEFRMREGQLI